jgi:hypothetical protein
MSCSAKNECNLIVPFEIRDLEKFDIEFKYQRTGKLLHFFFPAPPTQMQTSLSFTVSSKQKCSVAHLICLIAALSALLLHITCADKWLSTGCSQTGIVSHH